MFQLLTDINPATHKKNTFSIRLSNPSLSSGLDKIILKAANKDREQRYQSTEELKKALQSYHSLDIENVRREKAKKTLSNVLAAAASACLVLSGLSFFMDMQQADNKYRSLVSDTQNTKHIEQAISLKPQNAEGYTALLNSYGDSIDQSELSSFSHVFAEHQGEIRNKSEVAMAAGEKILALYSDESLRGKLFAAEPYFSAVEKDFEGYPAANAYVSLASFYREYVMQENAAIVKEAGKKEYEDLLYEMDKITDSVSDYSGSERNNLMLTVSELCLGIISEQCGSMKGAGVTEQDIYSTISKIENAVKGIESSVKSVSQKKDADLKTIKNTREAVKIAYSRH